MSETAMVLTQEEWEDVAHMLAHYKLATDWARRIEATDDINRRRQLADRIIDAAEVAA